MDCLFSFLTCSYIGGLGMIYPCYGCEDRVVGCHANCERYLTTAAKDREIRMANVDPVKAYVRDTISRRVNDVAKRHRAGKGQLNTLKR